VSLDGGDDLGVGGVDHGLLIDHAKAAAVGLA
jgi:hypothetical protein